MEPLNTLDEAFLRTIFLERVMTALLASECQKAPDPVAAAARLGESMRAGIAKLPMPDGAEGENYRLHLEDISNSFFDHLTEIAQRGQN